MLCNVQLKEEHKTKEYKGVLFYVIVQLEREISILLIRAIVGDPTKLAKRSTIMLGEQGPKLVVVAKGNDPRKRSLPDETRIAEVMVRPKLLLCAVFVSWIEFQRT